MLVDTPRPHPSAPVTHGARPAVRWQCGIAGALAVAALIAIILSAIPHAADPPIVAADRRSLAIVLGAIWAAFVVVLLLRIRLATATLRITGDGLEFGTFGITRRRIPWSALGACSFRSRRVLGDITAENVLLNAVLLVALLPLGFVGHFVRQEDFVATRGNNPFAGPGPGRKGRVPSGKLYGQDKKRLLNLSDSFGWEVYDDLIAEMLARDIVVFTDRLQLNAPAPDASATAS